MLDERYRLEVVVPAWLAAGAPFRGWEWHHHWAALPPLLNLMVLPLFLGAVVALLSAGRWWFERLGVRRELRHQHRVVADQREASLVSEAERERAGDAIARAMGDARLSLEEGLERIEQLWEVRSRRQLAALVGDLPDQPATRRSRSGLVGAFTLTFLAALVQGIVGIWELWPVAACACLIAVTHSHLRSER
jgi:hypothetical protein